MVASDKQRVPPMDRNAPDGRHAVFAGQAHADPLAAGAARAITCNTITHPTNAIDLAPALAQAAARMASHTKRRRAGPSRRSSVNT